MRKWHWTTLLILGVLAVSAYFYLRVRKSDDFEGLIKTKLSGLVSRGSKGLYMLRMDDVQIDVLKSTITASGVSLTADSTQLKALDAQQALPDDIYDIKVKELIIRGISAQDMLNKKNISLSQIYLQSPDVVITHQKRAYNRQDTSTLYSRIADAEESYELKNLLVENIRLTYKNPAKNDQVSVLQNMTAILDDIKIDKQTATDSSRFLFAKDANIYLKKYATYTTDKLYRFTIDSIALKPQKGILRASDIRLEPQGNKDQFSKKLKVLKDRFDIFIRQGYVEDINWWSLISNDGFPGDKMKLSGGYIKIYDDRRLPPAGNKVGNYPHQMLRSIDFPIKMNSIALSNIDVSYEELNPVSNKSGTISFTNTSGEINNITNITAEIAKAPFMKVKALTTLLNDGRLEAAFSFDLSRAAAGIFSADARLGPMDGEKANKAVNGLAMVEIEKLQIDKLVAHIDGSNNSANGKITFAYHDLKIAALKKDEDGKFKKRKVLSFLANAFVIRSSSPSRGGPLKTQTVSYTRDPNRSFFNLIWQTMAKGIVLTARGK